MSYYKQNKDKIIKNVLKLRQSSIELRLRYQNYQHEYYLKHRTEKLDRQSKIQKFKTWLKNLNKEIKTKSQKEKENNNTKRVKRHIKSYKKIKPTETLEIEFD